MLQDMFKDKPDMLAAYDGGGGSGGKGGKGGRCAPQWSHVGPYAAQAISQPALRTLCSSACM